METKRVIVAGSRTYNNYEYLSEVLSKYTYTFNKLCIRPEFVSGGCRGVDSMAERFCKSNNYPIKIFNADWDRYGKSAGYIRNKEMAQYASETGGFLIAFWDGKSRGTKMMIKLAKENGLVVKILPLK